MINWALPWLKLPWFIKKYQKIKPPIRHLTDGEVALARGVFGELMDYNRVRVVNYPYIPWQSDDVFIAPNGWIFVGGRHYRDDFSAHGRLYQQIFIHEMTHVLQYQHGINVLLKGAWLQTLYYLSLKKYNPYRYTFDQYKSFWDYNIEQQGRIAEHIYLGKIPNILCKRH